MVTVTGLEPATFCPYNSSTPTDYKYVENRRSIQLSYTAFIIFILLNLSAPLYALFVGSVF